MKDVATKIRVNHVTADDYCNSNKVVRKRLDRYYRDDIAEALEAMECWACGGFGCSVCDDDECFHCGNEWQEYEWLDEWLEDYDNYNSYWSETY